MPRLTESERLRIVHLRAEGYTAPSIAAKVGCSVKTVRFWVNRYRSSGSAKSIPASGRPLLMTTAARKRAVHLLVDGVDGSRGRLSGVFHVADAPFPRFGVPGPHLALTLLPISGPE